MMKANGGGISVHSNDDGIGLFKLYYKMRLPKKRNINTVKRIFYRKGDTKWKFEVYGLLSFYSCDFTVLLEANKAT